jgi:transposase
MSPGINQRINVFITKIFASKKIVSSLHRKRRTKELIYHVKKVMKYAKKRGLKRLILFLDNTSTRRSRQFKRFKLRNKEFLKVVALPEYSPNLNDIERINRMIQKDVASNRFWETVTELRKL